MYNLKKKMLSWLILFLLGFSAVPASGKSLPTPAQSTLRDASSPESTRLVVFELFTASG